MLMWPAIRVFVRFKEVDHRRNQSIQGFVNLLVRGVLSQKTISEAVESKSVKNISEER